jgi:beta-barrel assembly-enhancing protease
MRSPRIDRPTVVLLVIAALSVPAFADDKKKDVNEIGNRDVGKGINFYSIEKEIALGKQLAEEVMRQARMFQDSLIGEYVNRVCQSLVRNSDAKMPVTCSIIDADDLNAFALPGGFIFVHTGLLKAAETEAELAGALAHEIAHVAARHMTKQATRSQLAQILTLPASILIGGWTGYAIRQGLGVGIPMTFLKMDRGFESEADYYGLQYMYKAGYDPEASVDLFERMLSLQKRRPGTINKVFATHPQNGDRLRKTQEEIATILPAKAEYIVNTSEYMEMRARLFAMQSQRKSQETDPHKPTLRRTPGGGTIPGNDADAEKSEKQDDSPTLKRREWVE